MIYHSIFYFDFISTLAAFNKKKRKHFFPNLDFFNRFLNSGTSRALSNLRKGKDKNFGYKV